jgi:hypothetical protein
MGAAAGAGLVPAVWPAVDGGLPGQREWSAAALPKPLDDRLPVEHAPSCLDSAGTRAMAYIIDATAPGSGLDGMVTTGPPTPTLADTMYPTLAAFRSAFNVPDTHPVLGTAQTQQPSAYSLNAAILTGLFYRFKGADISLPVGTYLMGTTPVFFQATLGVEDAAAEPAPRLIGAGPLVTVLSWSGTPALASGAAYNDAIHIVPDPAIGMTGRNGIPGRVLLRALRLQGPGSGALNARALHIRADSSAVEDVHVTRWGSGIWLDRQFFGTPPQEKDDRGSFARLSHVTINDIGILGLRAGTPFIGDGTGFETDHLQTDHCDVIAGNAAADDGGIAAEIWARNWHDQASLFGGVLAGVRIWSGRSQAPSWAISLNATRFENTPKIANLIVNGALAVIASGTSFVGGTRDDMEDSGPAVLAVEPRPEPRVIGSIQAVAAGAGTLARFQAASGTPFLNMRPGMQFTAKGFANPENNGVFLVASVPSSTAIQVNDDLETEAAAAGKQLELPFWTTNVEVQADDRRCSGLAVPAAERVLHQPGRRRRLGQGRGVHERREQRLALHRGGGPRRGLHRRPRPARGRSGDLDEHRLQPGACRAGRADADRPGDRHARPPDPGRRGGRPRERGRGDDRPDRAGLVGAGPARRRGRQGRQPERAQRAAAGGAAAAGGRRAGPAAVLECRRRDGPARDRQRRPAPLRPGRHHRHRRRPAAARRRRRRRR